MSTYKMLPGGLWVAVQSMNHDPVHHAVLEETLRAAIKREAEAHHALNVFDPEKFGRVTKAIERGKVIAQFMIAKWENCQPRVIGAAVEFPTIIVKDGKPYMGRYREDTCFLPANIKLLAKDRPKSKAFPENIGLCEYFERELVKDGRIGTFAEYSLHSTQMIKAMNSIGAKLGKKEDGTILELGGDAPIMRNRWPETVHTYSVFDENNKHLDYAFYTSWASKDGQQKMHATFTEAISTFTGEAIVRVQITSEGKIPEGKYLEHIVASLIEAGQSEIRNNRNWGTPDLDADNDNERLLISIHGEPRENLLGAEFSTKIEVFKHKIDEAPLFYAPVPTMRIHAELKITHALENIEGVSMRTLGAAPNVHPLYSVNHNVVDLAEIIGNFERKPIRPLNIIPVHLLEKAA